MAGSFGARLRQHREQQQIALESIVDQTKIQLSLLEALERDDVSRWPTGIFRRAYIRAYAQAIGLAPDAVVREFQELYPDPDELAALADLASRQTGSWRPASQLRNLVSSALAHVAGGSSAAAEKNPTRATPPVPEVSTGPFAEATRVAPAPPVLADSTPADGLAHDVNVNAERAIDIEAAADPVRVDPATASPVQAEEAASDGAAADPFFVAPALAFVAPPLDEVAQLCTKLAQVENAGDLSSTLREMSTLLGATGLIVWVWHAERGELAPAAAEGYSDAVVAQIPGVPLDANNATAAAFRAARICTVDGGGRGNGAMVAPLMRGTGCVGVLAFEIPAAHVQDPSMAALATIFAAQLATLIDAPAHGHAEQRRRA